MPITIDGTNGISDVRSTTDGTAATPAIRGTDTNTGIFFPAADTIAFSEGGTEVARFDSAGNLGIGTTSPAAKLVIDGGTSTDQMRIGHGSNYYSIGRETATTGFLNFYGTQSGANGYVFGGINGERMRIDSSGNLLIGTTSSLASTRLSVVGTANGMTVQAGNGSVGGYLTNTSGTGNWTPFSFNNNGTSFNQIGSISCTASATAYNTSSDYRLKENIAPMTGALGVVQQLKPVTYNWKVDGSSSQGFIAHELQAVVPDCVTGEKDAVDAEGKPVYQGIDTSFLVATLTAAIQELKAIVDAQTIEIQALKGAA